MGEIVGVVGDQPATRDYDFSYQSIKLHHLDANTVVNQPSSKHWWYTSSMFKCVTDSHWLRTAISILPAE